MRLTTRLRFVRLLVKMSDTDVREVDAVTFVTGVFSIGFLTGYAAARIQQW
jgi:hypothetical protein